ncbi:MAG: hypothetical protein AN485_24165, partial [Anabaena sp. MDT14b]
DRGLRSGALVHRLHDHRTIGRGQGRVCGIGARSRHQHRIGRHLASEDRAGLAVDDGGGRGQVDPHRQHAAFTYDHTLGDLGARPYEAVVLDDRGIGLQRLQHPANACAA